MNVISKFVAKINAAFKNPKVEAVFNTVAEVVTMAEPVVSAIAAMTPNRTVQEIEAAYERYAVPVAGTITADPTSTGNAMLNLATAVLVRNLGKSAPALNVIQTAIQIAVTAAKAA